MESIIEFVTRLDITYIYIAAFAVAYIENIFPPFPSDVIVVFCGSLVAVGTGNVALTLALSTTGSTLGFMTMYWIGDTLGDRVLEKQKIAFIPVETILKVEGWFRQHGYWIVIANRFLAGTRAAVSFFAGMSEMPFGKTIALSTVSSLAWNAILVYLGYLLGNNWKEVGGYLSTYSTIITIVIAALLALWLIRRYVLKRKADKHA